MYGFHTFLHFIGIRAIKDTQCGFKLFTRRACALIFPSMHVERWAFDVECLYLAERQGIPMIEVPVTWHEVRSPSLFPSVCASNVIGPRIKVVTRKG